MEPLFKFKDDQYPFTGVTHTREVVRAIFVDENDNVCLEYLKDDDGFGPRDYYETPGGGAKPNETHEETLHRELHEEVGYESEVICFLGYVMTLVLVQSPEYWYILNYWNPVKSVKCSHF